VEEREGARAGGEAVEGFVVEVWKSTKLLLVLIFFRPKKVIKPSKSPLSLLTFYCSAIN